MVDVQHPRPMPSTIPSTTYSDDSYRHSFLPIKRPVLDNRRTSTIGGQPHNLFNLSSVAADIHHGLRTPPKEMSGVSVNPLLAPNSEAFQYKSVPPTAPNGAPRQGTVGASTNPRPVNKVQPSQHLCHSRSRSYEQSSARQNGVKGSSLKTEVGIEDSSIVSYLQIPSSINGSKGSLAEFAAQITCLFWFESSFTLLYVEECKVTPTPIEPLVSESIPTMGFRKWVVSILSTTQVSQNVILLALMFIYRLKKLNPGVKGKLGSEFRLFTVALMLGNKFLDDNTYTNKTWAEVSGISVQEIHIMEVEFLSNMKYTLYASENEWKAWHMKLGKFWKYFEAGSKTPIEAPPKALNPPIPSPSGLPNLPSPPASTHTSPPYSTSSSFHNSTPSHSYPVSLPPFLPPIGPSPLCPLSEFASRSGSRKRSHDQALDSAEPPAKRQPVSALSSVGSSTTLTPSTLDGFTPNTSFTTPSTGHTSSLSGPKLPTPNLSISTGNHGSNYVGGAAYQLPLPGGSSQSAGLPAGSRLPHGGVLPPLNQNMRFGHDSGSHSSSPVADWSARHFPYSTSAVGTPSPTSLHFPQSAHTPTHLSPAQFPFPRNSPYKPIRTFNTLLVPPPSASMQKAPQNLNFNQMHYQPLGKPISQSRAGVLPNLQHDSWGQPQDRPLYLPQPRFAS